MSRRSASERVYADAMFFISPAPNMDSPSTQFNPTRFLWVFCDEEPNGKAVLTAFPRYRLPNMHIFL